MKFVTVIHIKYLISTYPSTRKHKCPKIILMINYLVGSNQITWNKHKIVLISFWFEMTFKPSFLLN